MRGGKVIPISSTITITNKEIKGVESIYERSLLEHNCIHRLYDLARVAETLI